MATTTFSGPIKAGTIKNTTGTTLGSDVKNVGFTVWHNPLLLLKVQLLLQQAL